MSEYDDILTPDVKFHLVRRMERHKVIALAGPRLLAHEKKYLEFHHVSGVILFSRNVESLSQLRELVCEVRTLLAPDGAPPPLVMSDHEGDFVSELRAIIGAPPSALALAATGDLEMAREVARETGLAMHKLGLNAVLAPVADLFLDPSSPLTGLRTFGCDPERVARFVALAVEGYRSAGIAACVKHFPGHGATADDSHETLPEVPRTNAQLHACDLVPFQAALDAGVEMVMMSHVAYPMGRSELIPASFDARIAQVLLRDEMKFSGVVITDALEMAGARWYAQSRSGGMGGGYEHALLAGADLLLHTRPIPEHVRVEGQGEPVMSINVMDTIIRTLEKVVDRGRVDEKLNEAARDNEALRNVLGILDRSWARVNDLRAQLPPTGMDPAVSSAKVVSFRAYPTVPTVYRDVAVRSVCADVPEGGIDPMPADAEVLVVPVQYAAGEVLACQDLDGFLETLMRPFPGWSAAATIVDFVAEGDGFRPVVAAHGPHTVVDASLYSGSAGAPEAVLATGGPVVVVYSARGNPGEVFAAGLQQLVEELDAVCVVVTGWPTRDALPRTVPVLYSLGASAQTGAAVAGVLAGEIEACGQLDGLLP